MFWYFPIQSHKLLVQSFEKQSKGKKQRLNARMTTLEEMRKNISDGSKDQRTINAFFTFTEWIFMKDPP